jgi:glycosyltransferase involved in cell wall biosynthesis
MSSRRVYDLSIVGTVGLPAAYGGFETLAEQLTLRLSAQRAIQVFCTGKRQPDKLSRPQTASGAALTYVEWDANGWQSMPYDFISLWRAARQTKTILVLGVSGCLLLPIIRLLWPQTRIVTNVDGLEWRRQKWGPFARFVLKASEWSAATFSHAIVADNQGIREHITKTYKQESILIAYGGDQAGQLVQTLNVKSNITSASDTEFVSGSYFFSVCRIEPENHIAEILSAFEQTPEAKLVLVGNWNVSDYAKQLRNRYSGAANMELKDPIYDQERLYALRTQAKAYLHGHSAGGTNPSLVEAMHAGMPVIAYDVDYNRHTTHNEAIYWLDAATLAVRICNTTDAELDEIAQHMTAIARQHYTWSVVTQQYEDILFPDH